jgi:hypothetical protein
MTYPTRAEQFTTAEPKYIERAELETLTKVGAQTIYGLAVLASGLDAVTCQQRQASTAPFSGPGTFQVFWCPGANPLPVSPVIQLATSPFTAFTPVSAVVAAVTRDPGGPGSEVTVTWRAFVDANSDGVDDGTPPIPAPGAQLSVSFTAYSDLSGAVLVADKTGIDLGGCDLTPVTGGSYAVRYRSKVKPLYSQEH